VLGIPAGASSEEVRRAYLRRARLYHPDRNTTAAPAEAARTARAMQEVNEAWRVLRDPARRRAYDQRLSGPSRPRVIFVDLTSRHPDPDVDLDPRPYHHPDVRLDDVSSRVIRGLPWIVIVAVLAVMFVFTAYAGSGGDDGGDRAGINNLVGECVAVQAGLGVVAVPCEGPNDGRVALRVERPSQCPSGTTAYVEPEEAVTLCLRPE
jgi:hypothetical protein